MTTPEAIAATFSILGIAGGMSIVLNAIVNYMGVGWLITGYALIGMNVYFLLNNSGWAA